jgi:hypothetical protein
MAAGYGVRISEHYSIKQNSARHSITNQAGCIITAYDSDIHTAKASAHKVQDPNRMAHYGVRTKANTPDTLCAVRISHNPPECW